MQSLEMLKCDLEYAIGVRNSLAMQIYAYYNMEDQDSPQCLQASKKCAELSERIGQLENQILNIQRANME